MQIIQNRALLTHSVALYLAARNTRLMRLTSVIPMVIHRTTGTGWKLAQPSFFGQVIIIIIIAPPPPPPQTCVLACCYGIVVAQITRSNPLLLFFFTKTTTFHSGDHQSFQQSPGALCKISVFPYFLHTRTRSVKMRNAREGWLLLVVLGLQRSSARGLR